MTYLFAPPQVMTLPLSKGGDLHVTFMYEPLIDGTPTETDYPAGATVTLIIDTADTPTSIAATITGSSALVHLDHTQADAVKGYLPWRLILTTNDGVDTVIVNGTTARADGS